MEHVPYTYRIYHKPTKMYYYGVKYSNTPGNIANPINFWKSYFTSSDSVKQLIAQYGVDSFDCEIRRVFKTAEEAIIWEMKVTKRVMTWPNYLNKSAGGYYGKIDKEVAKKNGKLGGIIAKENNLGWYSEESKKKREDSINYKIQTGYKIHKGLDEFRRRGGVKLREAQIAAHNTKLENGHYERLASIGGKCIKGKLWWNNGEINKRSVDSPGDGWVSGRLITNKMKNSYSTRKSNSSNGGIATRGLVWWNNGVINTRAKTQPGEDWRRGKIKGHSK